ncbi:MAG: ferritin family protein [Candidatus Thermoplasmatota archaeon]|nr:ferritin family protein [Candidatus Thermoplasmatota archaeon]
MDLSKYKLEDMLSSAIKSEVESHQVYTMLYERTKNAFLRDRFKFLAGEEAKHKAFLEKLWQKKFPEIKFSLPKESPVPMPAILIPNEHVHLSQVLESAMGAEKAASQFYSDMRGWVDDKESKDLLAYLSKMEMGHYHILEVERNNSEEFEDFDAMWPMMHAGP